VLAERIGLAADVARVRAGFGPALSVSVGAAWRGLAAAGQLDPRARPPDLELPPAFAEMLACAVALEESEGSARAEALRAHYLERMPRAAVEQLATRAEPNASLFHTRLEPARLPRLGATLERLAALLDHAGVPPAAALPAARLPELCERFPTLAELYRATHYGGFMPLLYGTPADLARAARSGLPPLEAIDRYMCAPIVHELAHLGRARRGLLPLYLDECIAAHLGVLAHPGFAYPGPDEDDGVYATPWFAQVGQALARVVGRDALLRAHAGVAAWEDVLPAGFLDAALELGWAEYRERRGPHFLSDSFRPDPWLKLVFGARGGRDALEAAGWPALSPVADDHAALADALAAMCLENTVHEGAYAVRMRPPPGPVRVDVAACRVSSPRRAGSADLVSPAYLFPPAFAHPLQTAGIMECFVHIADLAQIRELAMAPPTPSTLGSGPWRASSS
jgi:hypothetical protein